MRKAFSLIAALATASPCFADDLPKFDDVMETFFVEAQHRPDFHVDRFCPATARCQTVATATRAPDRNGIVGKDIFIKYDGKDQKIWCYQDVVGANTHTRLCQRADPRPEWRARLDRSLRPRRDSGIRSTSTMPPAAICNVHIRGR
jgi:hypothetical protein